MCVGLLVHAFALRLALDPLDLGQSNAVTWAVKPSAVCADVAAGLIV